MRHWIIGVTAGLFAGLPLGLGLNLLAAWAGLSTGPMWLVDILFWTIVAVCLVGAGALAWRVRRATRRWAASRALGTSILCLLLDVVVLAPLLFLLLPPFGIGADNRIELVSSQRMSVFLPDNTRIPPSGSNIHVQIWGSIDPGMVLRFTAEPDEARAFVQQVRQAWSMTPGVLEKGEYEAKPHNCPSDRWHADWWQARDDLPWWVDSRGHGCEFVQLVEHESTVYFFVSLH